MQTLPRLFCRFRRFWFSQKSARLLFFLPRGSEILRQNAAKRCVAAVGKAKKKRFFREILCLLRISEKNRTNLLSLMQNVAYEPLMLQPSVPLLRATSDIFSLPPHHLIGFTALPFSCTFLCILHPVLHLRLSENAGNLRHWCRKCRTFSWKLFFEGGRKGRKPEIENIGLLCIKHPYFHAKTSALYIIEVRCF